MSLLKDLIQADRRARAFMLAYLQSSLGTGAAMVVLIVLAYERLRSPWAITVVFLATFSPSMLLGPLAGAMTDRFSRRSCAIAADLVRALAFAGIALIPSFAAMAVLAAVAGAATSVFNPAALASLPELSGDDGAQRLTALFGASTDLGRTVGPALAAPLLLAFGASGVMFVNAATFALSAAVLARLSFGATAPGGSRPPTLWRALREGVGEARRLPVVRVVIVSAGATMFFAALLNVPELLVVRKLGLGATGFAYLVALLGVGVTLGSLLGARHAPRWGLERRYLEGVAMLGLGLAAISAARSVLVAALAFFLYGLGNGFVVVNARLTLQTRGPAALKGRLFALIDTSVAWAFALAFVSAGAIAEAIGVRPLLTIGAVGCLTVCALTAAGLALERRAPVAQLRRRRFRRYDGTPATGGLVSGEASREASTARTASL